MESTSGPAGPPPPDAEQWTDEQWIAWLDATDDSAVEAEVSAARDKRERHRHGVLGLAMLGLRDAIYGHPDDEAAVIADAPGGPPGDDQPQVRLDLEHPERSAVIVQMPVRRPENDSPE